MADKSVLQSSKYALTSELYDLFTIITHACCMCMDYGDADSKVNCKPSVYPTGLVIGQAYLAACSRTNCQAVSHKRPHPQEGNEGLQAKCMWMGATAGLKKGQRSHVDMINTE